MFQRLQQKWKVTGLQLVFILSTFAIGGSLTGYVGRRLLNLLSLEKGVLWVILYILLVTLLWPLAVLVVSIPFGQFPFFINYLKKIGTRMGFISPKTNEITLKSTGSVTNMAIFASGAGSNAQKIIDHFRKSTTVKIKLIVCNKPGAGILKIAENEHIPVILLQKEAFFSQNSCINELKSADVHFIVLAGFLWKIPSSLIQAYPGHIINIHPALLPKYGGKGMYGHHVHQAVIAAGDGESGITIHYVDEEYDHGATILQARCPVLSADTAESLAQRIHQLEHEHYPKVIERLLDKLPAKPTA
jgi:formyltetrahydrofolate-dependent phosphoribosylglycinamide formyltransferase